MANAQKVNPPIPPPRTPPPWDAPGDVVLIIELDANEAEAVRRALHRADYTRLKANLAHAERALPASSLIASGARVHEALAKAGA